METDSDRAILPVPFVPGDPPSQVPLERMGLDGTMDGVRVVGRVTGLIADIDLGDGRRVVSCAFTIEAEPATWEE